MSIKGLTDRDSIDTLAEDLAVAWQKYIALFGQPPRGTARQLSAMLELIPNKQRLLAALAAVANGEGKP